MVWDQLQLNDEENDPIDINLLGMKWARKQIEV